MFLLLSTSGIEIECYIAHQEVFDFEGIKCISIFGSI